MIVNGASKVKFIPDKFCALGNLKQGLIVVLFHRRVAPHLFELVKLTAFRHHYVNNDVHVIDQDPLQVLLSFVMIRGFAAVLFDGIFYGLGDCPDLGLVIRFANDEKIGNSFGYFPEVERYYVLTLLTLYCPNNGFVDFRIPV